MGNRAGDGCLKKSSKRAGLTFLDTLDQAMPRSYLDYDQVFDRPRTKEGEELHDIDQEHLAISPPTHHAKCCQTIDLQTMLLQRDTRIGGPFSLETGCRQCSTAEEQPIRQLVVVSGDVQLTGLSTSGVADILLSIVTL